MPQTDNLAGPRGNPMTDLGELLERLPEGIRMKPRLRIIPATPAEKARVIGITFRRNDAHELRCIQAIRARSHPAWSQHHVSWRLGERMALRGVG